MAGQTAVQPARTGNNVFLKAVAAISTCAGWVSAGLIVAAVGVTCQMIFVRFVLNGSTVWQTEAVIYMVLSATLIGLSYVQHLRGHVNVDLLPIALPRKMRFALCIFTLSLSCVVVGIMLYYSYEYWHLVYKRGWRSDTVWGVSLWKAHAALPIGFALLLLQLIADLVAVLLRVEAPFGVEDT